MSFWTNLLNLVHSFLGVILLLASLLVALLVIVLLVKKLSGDKKKPADEFDLLQIHESVEYEHLPSLAKQHKDKEKKFAFKLFGKEEQPESKPIAVLRFDGDLFASARKEFARLIDEVIANADRFKSAVVVVSSPGGAVAEYGQMFAEMERLRKASIHLTVCIDTYAASGGYLMSLPANKIVAAPFAIVGSIGVVSEFPNFYKMLTKAGIEPVTVTAGKYKRTLTPLAEVTKERKDHFQQQLEAIHSLFIKAVTTYRKVSPDQVCNGDHWTARESIEKNLGLVDEIATSQEYLFAQNKENDLLVLSDNEGGWKKGLLNFFAQASSQLLSRFNLK